jgi:hypothetical protein
VIVCPARDDVDTTLEEGGGHGTLYWCGRGA